MGKERKSDATSLGEILEAASRQQLSGLLRIEQSILRTQVTRGEEGEVYLLAGQPISAQSGKRTGQEALQYLLTWHPIRFSLSIDAPRPVANVFAHLRVHPALSPLPPLPLEQMVPRRKRVEQDARSLPLTRPNGSCISSSMENAQWLTWLVVVEKRSGRSSPLCVNCRRRD